MKRRRRIKINERRAAQRAVLADLPTIAADPFWDAWPWMREAFRIVRDDLNDPGRGWLSRNHVAVHAAQGLVRSAIDTGLLDRMVIAVVSPWEWKPRKDLEPQQVSLLPKEKRKGARRAALP